MVKISRDNTSLMTITFVFKIHYDLYFITQKSMKVNMNRQDKFTSLQVVLDLLL